VTDDWNELEQVRERREDLRRNIAGTIRRFAELETETAMTLRRTADLSRDPENAERKRLVASEAEKRGRWALERANRFDSEEHLALDLPARR